METISRKLARFAAGLKYENLPPRAVAEAKRFLIDSLGCAVGGTQTHDARIMREFIEEEGGRAEATLIGTRKKVPASWAAFYNALVVRALDYNDIYWKADPSHPSDILPAALAIAEKLGTGGKDVLLGIVIGHELEMRFCEAAEPGIRERGWHHATLTAFVAPIVAAKMLGLDSARIQHAIGISGSRMATFGAVTAGKLTMMKNTVDPLATQSGVLAALLAERGYTGPEHVIEGKEGLVHCLGPQWKLEILEHGLGQSYRIGRCGMKAFPTEALTHAPISCTLDLVREHDLRPEQIERVHIRSLGRAADILADPSKYDPRSKETADHSLPYVIACAIAERQVTPLQFTEAKIMDPTIRAQLKKVVVVADPEIEALFPELQRVVVTIRTSDGRELTRQIDFPKGDPRNPLTDAEIEEKFDALAEPVLSPDRRRQVKEAVWTLERQEAITDLMHLLRSDRA